MGITLKSAVSAIDSQGVLLVFPITNRKEPASLWSHFHPRSQMKWEWDETGDNRVADLWHLRMELSRSSKVVYAKWYQGRATFFSRELFPAFLRALAPQGQEDLRLSLSISALHLLEILESDSPLSTKVLRRSSGLTGRLNESAYTRAMKELWSRLLIVGFGEVEDGAFPSLALGATRLLFEELWSEAQDLTRNEAEAKIRAALTPESLFLKYYLRCSGERPMAANS